jgi:signal transduction histidine kinase
MIITSNIDSSDIAELIEQINALLKIQKNLRTEYLLKDSNMKEVITNLSHDIRTPLTSLDGYFQLLVESEVQADRERYMKIIQSRIKSLKEMLEELFTYTKLQNDSFHLEVIPQNINRLFFDTIFSFYDSFTEMNMEPDVQVTEEQLTVIINEEALKRVLQNIIKNGLEHSEGHIRISLQRLNNKAVMIFQNTYKSSEIIDINKVFDRFYKADKARSNTSTGIGLSIAKELVKRMGGEISANLEEDIFQIRIEFKVVI